MLRPSCVAILPAALPARLPMLMLDLIRLLSISELLFNRHIRPLPDSSKSG